METAAADAPISAEVVMVALAPAAKLCRSHASGVPRNKGLRGFALFLRSAQVQQHSPSVLGFSKTAPRNVLRQTESCCTRPLATVSAATWLHAAQASCAPQVSHYTCVRLRRSAAFS
jgi:hypothetical protein